MALPIVVLASGTGSNLAAVGRAIEAGRCDAEIRAVLSDRPSAGALSWARERSIPATVVRPADFATRADWDQALALAIGQHAPQLLVLAGFMRLVGEPVLRGCPHRILNVHPALLPLFPGRAGPAEALAAGVRVSGCTVHVVDRGVDSGPILAQAAVPVLPDDDVERLHRRIQRAEHRLLPAVIDAIARGAISLGPEPRIDAIWFAPDGMLASPAIVPD